MSLVGDVDDRAADHAGVEESGGVFPGDESRQYRPRRPAELIAAAFG
jgi:hypothetical protein